MWSFVNLLQITFCRFGRDKPCSLIQDLGIFFLDRDRADLKFLISALILIDDIRIHGRGSNNTI